MKNYSKRSYTDIRRYIVAACVGVAGVIGLQAALTKSFYTSTSVLNSGKWVKIGVEKTGVYEISYETLRQMGFSDPSKVSLYGRGGRVLSESFVSNAGVPILTDDLAPVRVIHEDNMIYFYGLGPEEITFEVSSDYDTGGYFSRKGNNIYTRRGYYFLTDSKSPTAMAEKNYDTSGSESIAKGMSFIYHELDSVQNTTMTGQLFWGESFNLPGLTRKHWDVTMPDAIAGKGVMQCVMYLPDADFGDAKIVYGFDGTDHASFSYKQTGALYFTPQEPTVSSIPIPGNKGKVLVGLDNALDIRDYANLDFWVISYQTGVPTLKNVDGSKLNQQLMAFPGVEKNQTGKLQMANNPSLVALDVTSAAEPQRLKVTSQGAFSNIGVRNTGKTPVIVVFDKDCHQLQISGYETAYTQIENQNLHKYKEEGADFVIISTPRFKEYAEQIADLHREYDGLKVIVTTTEECYNEFSGGVPDPMAYRNFMKMLYLSGRQPKNLLLLGPLYGDFRGLQSEHNPAEGIIAYQSPSISVTRGGHNINDFYGMMSDKFRTDYYERNEVQIGVGILPIKFESEGKILVEKIKNYLERDDHAYYLNKYIGVGGIGDEHTHDIQLRDINLHINALDNNGTFFTPLAIDTYGNAEARKKFISGLNEGCNMFSYFGHGAEQFLGKNRYFFNAGDVFTIRNQIHPFALFGGCQITNTDRGYRGLGETIVTATPYGCIGSIVSARDTWSGQNYEFFKQFFTCLYTEGSTTNSARRKNPVTIGEVYSSVKNYSTYSNELSYQLLCDPALVLPIINRSIKVETTPGQSVKLKPGDKFSINGMVIFQDETVDTKFNGQLVLRLAQPSREVPAGSIESGQDTKGLVYNYRDAQEAISVSEVKDGKFTAEIHVPASMSSFEGENALLYFCVYDPSTKIGGAKSYGVTVAKANNASAESGDKTPPAVDCLEFNNNECMIRLAVSDNLALNLSNSPLNKGLYLYIDGKERGEAHFIEPVMESGKAAYSKNVYLEGISYGEHTARVKVKDAAGNSTEQEIIFSYTPAKGKYLIVKDELTSTPEKTVIRLQENMPQNASVVILSSSGIEVWRGEMANGILEWNHEFTSGDKVPSGHYKAYLIETGHGNDKGHSETIDIPVI